MLMFPYADFLLDFERKHGDLTHQNSPENTRAAVIVETRPGFFLPRVIRNVMYFLGRFPWCIRIASHPSTCWMPHETALLGSKAAVWCGSPPTES